MYTEEMEREKQKQIRRLSCISSAIELCKINDAESTKRVLPSYVLDLAELFEKWVLLDKPR